LSKTVTAGAKQMIDSGDFDSLFFLWWQARK
jgi:hypothetical protein